LQTRPSMFLPVSPHKDFKGRDSAVKGRKKNCYNNLGPSVAGFRRKIEKAETP
jgi:hypothetical protein